jgi:hypothetical protein
MKLGMTSTSRSSEKRWMEASARNSLTAVTAALRSIPNFEIS